MNTIVIFNSYDYGSTGTLCVSLKEACIRAGYKVFFVCGNKKKNGNGDYYVTDHNCKLLRYCINKCDIFFNKSLNGIKTIPTRKVIKFLKHNIDFKNDNVIFHYHNIQYSSLSLNCLSKFANKNNIRTIITLHDCWPFTGGCNYFDLNECRCWEKEMCTNCPCNYHNSYKELKNKSNLFSRTTVISPSIWLDKLVSSSVLSFTNHFVINNGIDTSFWDYSKESKKSDKINLIAVASPWDKRKGLSLLNSIAELLPCEYTLTIVGLDSAQYTHPKIIRFGKLNKFQLKELYGKSHILVNPTLEDNFPTVNIEALLCGLYIYSFDTGGSKEIYDKDTGYTVQEKTASNLLSSILKFKYSDEISLKCRKRGLTFNLENFCSSYLTVYTSSFKL